MEALYTPVHMPADSVQFRPLNVVVLFWRAFSKESSGFLNEELDNGTYKGYMPFLDSLMAEGSISKTILPGMRGEFECLLQQF